ncbi:hypothetical protein ASG23_06410 [Cellulomonas sp. Leaf395]|nr:hypothetical protein ASG23_06410 [Cellulomonas sp. Leaf395]
MILGISVISSASASPMYPNQVTYTGQGLNDDGTLQNNNCEDGTAPYLLFVLTANKATAADITLPSGTYAMVQSGNGNGAFKFMADYQDPAMLVDNVIASYDGMATNAQLVISHGCEGEGTPTPSPSWTS